MDRGLELDGLHKRYGDTVALDSLSFEVRPGELFGFVGSNGAGKTTAMRIVLGVLDPDAGEVRFAGRRLDLDARRRIGYMPEERGLYPKMRVGEQLTWMAELRGRSHTDAAQRARAWTERLGVDGRWNDRVEELSLGNQQRVQLAAALVHDPDLLVLDEPFSGLDPVAVDVMAEVLRERCAAGVPVLFSSHQLDLVERLCDRVGIVRDGRLVACGAVEELRAGSQERRVEVVADALPPDWLSDVAGAQVVRSDARSALVELSGDADDQAVLRAALAAGPVLAFSPQRASLTDLFRDVVHVERAEGAA